MLTLCLVVAFACYQSASAQESPDIVVAKIEAAIKQKDPTWNCEKVYTPQGEPSEESPRGTEHMFKCQKNLIYVTVYLLYGESSRDAEKQLKWSQRLPINESKPITGIGEQGYGLSKSQFAWITFRKSRVYCQVNVSTQNAFKNDGSTQIQSIPADDLKEASLQFAHLVADQIPL